MIPARGRGVVKTDLSIGIPKGTYARIAPRSGLAVKNFIDTGAGVVDEDYRGSVGVVLFNHGDADFAGKPSRAGQRGPALPCLPGLSLLACLPACPLAWCPTKGSCSAVKKGDRVAQLILERIVTPEVVEVQSLDDTTRGANGYGSTGVSS